MTDESATESPRWDAPPVWIRSGDDDPPICDDHDSVMGPVNFTPVIEHGGTDVEYQLRDGHYLWLCGMCLSGSSDLPVGALSRHIGARWEDAREFFERAGAASPEVLAAMVNPYANAWQRGETDG